MSAAKVKELEKRLAETQAELAHAQERIKALTASNRDARAAVDVAEAVTRDFTEGHGLIEVTFDRVELPYQLHEFGLESWLGVGAGLMTRRKRWRENFITCRGDVDRILPAGDSATFFMKRK